MKFEWQHNLVAIMHEYSYIVTEKGDYHVLLVLPASEHAQPMLDNV